MLIAIIIAFVGLVIGQVLASQVKEELKVGKKWFLLIAKIALLVILIKLLLISNLTLMFFISLIIGILVNYFLKRPYFYFGFLILLINFVSLNDKLFFISLIFIFGLAFGSIIYSRSKKFNYKTTLINLILFLLPLLFLLNQNLVSSNLSLFTGFIFGGLIIGLIKLS